MAAYQQQPETGVVESVQLPEGLVELGLATQLHLELKLVGVLI
jgi:hypothetical protein